ncbi:MAG: VOC family protein [Chloroflexi bacterium]|nr:VOC family protein [Chloroflexota bacterium]
MTDTAPQHRSMLQPLLVVHNAVAAIEFYTRVFGAVEQWRLMHYHRVGHCVLRIGESEFALLDEFPEAGIKAPPADEPEDAARGRGPRLMVQVEDVDAVLRRAAANGGTHLRQAEDQWWGVRSGGFRDPFGHRWSVYSVVEPISIEEMQRRADELDLYPPPPSTPDARQEYQVSYMNTPHHPKGVRSV